MKIFSNKSNIKVIQQYSTSSSSGITSVKTCLINGNPNFFVIYNGNVYSQLNINVFWADNTSNCNTPATGGVLPSSSMPTIVVHYPTTQYAQEQCIYSKNPQTGTYYCSNAYIEPLLIDNGIIYAKGYAYNQLTNEQVSFCFYFYENNPDSNVIGGV